jgi:hypothetical protein
MRSQLGNFVVTVAMAVLVSPVHADRTRDSEVVSPVAVQRVGVLGTGVRDEAAMVLVGTALIALAAAVRRAS